MLGWLKKNRSSAAETDRVVVSQVDEDGTHEKQLAECAACKQRGNALLGEGRVYDAVASYRQAVALDPKDAGAHIALGFALREQKAYADAEAFLKQALSLDPAAYDAYYMLGGICEARGDLVGAIGCYQSALSLKPDFDFCCRDLSRALFQVGRAQEAKAVISKGLEINPGFADLHFYRGNLCLGDADVDSAIACFKTALSIHPEYFDAHFSLGSAHQRQGSLDAAISCYRRASELNPSSFEAHRSLGYALLQKDDLDASLNSYRDALSINPQSFDVNFHLGLIHWRKGDIENARQHYERARVCDPENPEVLNNLGDTLLVLGDAEASVRCLEKAIALRPDFSEAHFNLGNALTALDRLDAAIGQYRIALSMTPGLAQIHCNLGNAYQARGDIDAAIDSYERALLFDPACKDAEGNRLFVLNYHPQKDAEEIFSAYRRYDEERCQPLRGTWRSHLNSRQPGRRLKVGYVSPDFRSHSVRHFLEPLLARHDRNDFELYAFAELKREDQTSERYRGYVDHWIPTRRINDEQLVERIRAEEIDILVDVAGHTAGNRLGVFARKPAPISVSWLGFGYTTGLTAIDYFLTDETCAPAGCDGLFSESPWRLATPAFVYRPATGMGEAGPLPALERKHVTFGTLTRAIRLNDRVIGIWSEILRRVPGSRLVIDAGNFRDIHLRKAFAARFAAHGIGQERLEIGCHSPPWGVLRGFDIGLDCFPHSSGTTLFETLYMGVPYVTLEGRPSAGRLGSSVLKGLGRREWIAQTEPEYVDIAVSLTENLHALAGIRAVLRAEMEAGALMDELGFARRVEAAYREMWVKWCNGSGDCSASGDISAR